MSDEEIIIGYLEGKKAAFNLVTDWIRATVYSRVWQDGVSAEDIVADSRVKLYLNLRSNKFKAESSLKSYVQRIAQYTTVDAMRIHERVARYSEVARNESPPNTDILEEVIRKEDLIVALRIVSSLGEECLKLWEMLLKEEIPYKEIALRLNMTEGAVRIKIFRCRKEAIALRERFT